MVKNIDTTPGIRKKHIPMCKGSYEIKSVLPNEKYVVKDINGFQETQILLDFVYECKNITTWIKI